MSNLNFDFLSNTNWLHMFGREKRKIKNRAKLESINPGRFSHNIKHNELSRVMLGQTVDTGPVYVLFLITISTTNVLC